MTNSNSSTKDRFYMRFNQDANSYSVFERGRLNEFNEPYCVLPLVTKDEAEAFIANPHLQPEVAQTGVYAAADACQWTDGEQTFTGPHQFEDGRCATCRVTVSAFTPGPWGDWRREDGKLFIGTRNHVYVCEMVGPERDTEVEGNARLIAAAPQLYEATRELLATYQVTERFEPKTPEEARMANAVKLALAALALAEGEVA